MAMKIKKKKPESKAEQLPADELVTSGNPIVSELAGRSDLDSFEATALRAGAWIENNRTTVFALIGGVALAIVGVFAAVQYTKSQQVAASTTLSTGLAAYEVLVEGSPEYEALVATPDLEVPTTTFATETEKWQTIYDQADATLADQSSGPIASSARLTKAAAAFNLGKFDESAALYEAYLADSRADDVKPFAYLGLANSHAAAGNFDKALEQLDKFVEATPDKAALAQYEKARMLQRAGKADEARDLYHKILETAPETTLRSDIERRIATL